jgi:ribosomal protein S18 acetylase RimI-like enzyme
MILRAATAADIPAILEIEQRSFVHAGERFGQPRLEYLVASPRVMVTVAENDSTILAWSAAFTWTRTPTPWGRIYALAVHPHSRGQRLGPQLMDHMIQTLKDRGAATLFLEVRPDNHPAITLYKKYGFATCRELANYYGPGHPAIRMSRPA